MGRPIVTNGTLRRSCAKVREPSELRFGLLRGVGRGIAALDGGPRRARGMGGFEFFRFPIFTPTLLLGLFLELDCPERRPGVHAGLARARNS